MRSRLQIAITLGDPAGIGPEVVTKALRDRRLPSGFDYAVLGPTGPQRGVTLGKLTSSGTRQALLALEQAAEGCRSGRFAAMVTGPVHKAAMTRLHPGFIGQTEFLAQACGLPEEQAVMLMYDPKLTVALCSAHCSLREALDRLSPQRIAQVARLTQRFLLRLGVAAPRLALASVNPHRGESGLFGVDDEQLGPAAQKLLAPNGIPLAHLSADTVFFRAVQEKAFDAVICVYHDQGLIPFKLIAFETGVNVTLGLPIIRTSPDHGTALDLAGKNRADHRSMLAAIRLACRLARSSPC